MNNISNMESIQAKARLMEALKMAILETEKLNKILDEIHDSAIEYQIQKAA